MTFEIKVKRTLEETRTVKFEAATRKEACEQIELHGYCPAPDGGWEGPEAFGDLVEEFMVEE